MKTGKAPPELIGPELPLAVEHVWLWFQELSVKRTWGEGGPHPLQDHAVIAWARLTGRAPRYWELLLLWRLDHAFRAHVNAKSRYARPENADG